MNVLIGKKRISPVQSDVATEGNICWHSRPDANFHDLPNKVGDKYEKDTLVESNWGFPPLVNFHSGFHNRNRVG